MTDDFFWGRILDMPDLEAEQELMIRREDLTLQIAMLMKEREKASERNAKKISIEITSINAAISKINAQTKIVRQRMNRLSWKNAIKAIYGQEGVEQCLIWMEANK